MPGSGMQQWALEQADAPASSPVGQPVWHRGVRHYRLPNGQLAPAVTEVLTVIARPQLDAWRDRAESERLDLAWQAAVDGALPQEPVAGLEAPTRGDLYRAHGHALAAIRAEEKSRPNAAQTGTLLHEAIAWVLRGEMGLDAGAAPDLTAVPEAAAAFAAWSAWWEGAGFRPVAVERFVYSERHGFAGTLDFIYAVEDGARWLIDWKSAKHGASKPWPSYYLQLSAYRLALAEMGDPVDATAIVMLPKTGEPASFWPSPPNATPEGFLGALALWRALHAE